MDFSVFDTAQMDAYAKQAKEQWGETDAYKEFEQKSQGRSRDEEQLIAERFMQKFADFGKIKDMKPEVVSAVF